MRSSICKGKSEYVGQFIILFEVLESYSKKSNKSNNKKTWTKKRNSQTVLRKKSLPHFGNITILSF